MMENKKFLEVLEEIPGLVIGHDMSRFSEREYGESLEEYVRQNRPAMEKLEACCMEAEEPDEVISAACGAVLNAVERELKDKKYRGWNKRALQLDTYKMVILTYMTPAVFKMELKISEAFNLRFHDMWVERYPKEKYEVVTEEKIAAGFRKKWYQALVGK